jgi:hypothetical protein
MPREFWKSLPLLSKRGARESDGKLATHEATRHQDSGQNFLKKDGSVIENRGTLFPPHVSSGDISKIKKHVERQYALHRMGRASSVVGVESARFGKKVIVRVDSFGVSVVGAYVMMGHIMSVFPEESNGGTYLKLGGKKIKKSPLSK